MSSSAAVARNAMATRFEIVLYGRNEGHLRAAGEEALDEVERLDAQLSIYRPESELSRINRRAAFEAVRVEPQLFRLLERAQTISKQTNGAFDITTGPLIRCWGFMAGTGALPDRGRIEAARAVTGFGLVKLDERNFTVQFEKEGVFLDLGSIGKGYALDRAAEILRNAGIETALLHGGTSTTLVLGDGPEGKPSRVSIERPPETEQGMLAAQIDFPARPEPAQTLAILELKDQALSVSAVWGKAFVAEGRLLGHIIDPRTGWPCSESVLSAAVSKSAADSDAWSTALLVDGAFAKWLANAKIDRHLTCRYVDGKLEII